MIVKHLTGLVVAVVVLAGTATAADDATHGSRSTAKSDNLGQLYRELRQLESSAAERRSSLVTLRRDLESMKASLDQMSEGIDPVAPPADFINELRSRSPTPQPPETMATTPAPALAATESGSMIREMRRQMAPAAAPKRPTAPAAPAAKKPRAQAPARVARAPSPPPPQKPVTQPVTQPAAQPATKPNGASTRVQLASYRSRGNAERGWADLKKSYPDLLGDLQPEYVQVDIPDKGRFERLIVRAPVARDLCPQLKARGAYCIKAR